MVEQIQLLILKGALGLLSALVCLGLVAALFRPISAAFSRLRRAVGVFGLVGGSTGRVVTVHGERPGDARLVVRIGDATASPPTFDLKVVTNRTVKLSAWIVADKDGNSSWSETEIRQMVAGAEDVYRQLGVCLALESVVVTNLANAGLISYYGSTIGYPSRQQLMDFAHDTGGLELYFIEGFAERSRARTVAVNNLSMGIVLTRDASFLTLAHEIGHSFGMSDIYAATEDGREPTDVFCYNCAVDDWNGGCESEGNCRYYSKGTTVGAVVARLLMNGVCDDKAASESEKEEGFDITAGDIGGCWYIKQGEDKIWSVTAAPDFYVAPIGAFSGNKLTFRAHD